MKFKRKHLGALTAIAVATAAVAATVITLDPEITLSDGGNGHKPKLMRAADGTLVSVFGDSPEGAGKYYDPKADSADAIARDLYVKHCNPNKVDCNVPTNWTKAKTFDGTATDGNVTRSALLSSVSTAWQGGSDPTALTPFPGNAEKPNIKQTGPAMVLTWISQYCPDGDLRTDGIQPSAQRSIRYLERNNRVVPFACAWNSWSYDNGKTWASPRQLSNGERDAKQDSSGGTFDTATTTARIAISWQEDPEGLQLGEGDGPGDGASGANVTGGTDIWYTHMALNTAAKTVTFAPPSANISTTGNPVDGDGTERALGYRISDNWELEKKYGLSGQITNVLVNGVEVDGKTVEKGNAAAARANIGMVGTTTVLAWEETKGASGLAEGKFIRYRTFAYNQPPVISVPATTTNPIAAYANEKSGCVISQVDKSAKRVRFLTQSAAEATGVTAPAVPNRSGINIAIFWREGETDKGGPSDIVLRRGMVTPTAASNLQSGLATSRMEPAVDGDCATSDYIALVSSVTHAQGENISSRASVVNASVTGLTDDTELNFLENALAHRGVLRGDDLWVGYNYVSNLYNLWALQDVYDFWIRKFEYDPVTGGSWNLPRNVTNIKTLATNPNNIPVNVREPRIFGTPASNTNAGFCDGSATQDASFCQNRNVVYLLWGSQENCYPSDPNCGKDQGVYGTVSFDGGETYAAPVRISKELGSVFDDDNDAFETQPQTRPDGTKFYTVFNTENTTTGVANANYVSGSVAQVADPVTPPAPVATDDGGGCSAATGQRPVDPVLPLLASLGLLGWGLRRARQS
jgi:hypothetical protein